MPNVNSCTSSRSILEFLGSDHPCYRNDPRRTPLIRRGCHQSHCASLGMLHGGFDRLLVENETICRMSILAPSQGQFWACRLIISRVWQYQDRHRWLRSPVEGVLRRIVRRWVCCILDVGVFWSRTRRFAECQFLHPPKVNFGLAV